MANDLIDKTSANLDSTTDASNSQAPLENANTPPVLENSNIEWEGNPLYYQSGAKQGQLKKSAQKPEENKSKFKGLDLGALKGSASFTDGMEPPAPPDKKAVKAEKKIVEAKIASKLVMRILDTVTGWISGNTFGADFTAQQRNERNKYREELEQDWQDYLVTLDVPLHPALVALFGSVLYVAPAFETVKGREKTESIKTRVISMVVGKMFGGKKK